MEGALRAGSMSTGGTSRSAVSSAPTAGEPGGGLDRYENEITNNVNPLDSRTRFLVQAGWRLASAPVRAVVGLEGIRRSGKMGDVSASSRETRTFAGLSYLF